MCNLYHNSDAKNCLILSKVVKDEKFGTLTTRMKTKTDGITNKHSIQYPQEGH